MKTLAAFLRAALFTLTLWLPARSVAHSSLTAQALASLAADGSQGDDLAAPVGVAADGTIFAVAMTGGAPDADPPQGTLVKVSPAGAVTVLRTFRQSENLTPHATGIATGADGNFYALINGKTHAIVVGPDTWFYTQPGAVLKITPAGVVSTVFTFPDDPRIELGTNCLTNLVIDTNGTIYGSFFAPNEGGSLVPNSHPNGGVFKITSAGAFSVLLDFPGGTTGGAQGGPLMLHPNGRIYGVNRDGGPGPNAGSGAIYELTTAGAYTVRHLIEENVDGDALAGVSLALHPDGTIYGATATGPGTTGFGAIWRMNPATGAYENLFFFTSIDPNATGFDFMAFPTFITFDVDGNLVGRVRSSGGGVPEFFKFDADFAFTRYRNITGPNVVTGPYVATNLTGTFIGAEGRTIARVKFDGGSPLDPSGTVVQVLGTANIHAAGHSAALAPGGGGGGDIPQGVAVPPGTKSFKVLAASGEIAVTNVAATITPDGENAPGTLNVSAFKGVSAFGFPKAGCLVAVFLPNAEPRDPAPAALFTTSSTGDFTELSPALGQVFFVGDGLTGHGAGTMQKFNVPAGATRLFFGIADAPGQSGQPGGFADNSGAFSITILPEGEFAAGPPDLDFARASSPPTAPMSRGTKSGKNLTRRVLSLSDGGALGSGGDPVDAIFGNYTHTAIDLAMNGALALPPIVRSYSSADPQPGLLGYGWVLNFDLRVFIVDADTFDVRREDGHLDRFTRQAGVLVPPAPSVDQLVEISGGGYTLTTAERNVFTFDAMGRLTQRADVHGRVTTFTYKNGKLTTITDPAARRWKIAMNPAGRIASITDPSSRKVSYTYDASGDLVAVTNAAKDKTSYEYDDAHRITKVINPSGTIFIENTYDGMGRVIAQSDGRGVTKFRYKTGSTVITDPDGFKTTIEFDGQYRIVRRTDAASGTTSIAYDAAGHVAASTDALGATTQFGYDARGNLTAITDALGGVTTFTYDAHDNVLSVTDPLNHASTFTYTATDDVLTATDATNATTSFAYDARGLLTSITNSFAKTTTLAYDKRGNLTTITDPLGAQTTRKCDLAGRVTRTTDPLKRATTFAYSKTNLLLSRTTSDKARTRFLHGKDGTLQQVVDPLKRATTFAYTAQVEVQSVSFPDGRGESYQYTNGGRLFATTRSDGLIANRSYDTGGRLDTITTPEGRTLDFDYDEAGRTVAVTDANGKTFGFAYDALGRRSALIDANGGMTTFAYDAAGRFVAQTDPNNHTTTFAYDNAGRRTSQTDALNRTQTWSYDALGRLTMRALPTGQAITFAYDTANRLTTATTTNPATTIAFTYDAAGQRTTMTDATGTTNYAYDKNGRITMLAAPQGTIRYTYDKRGRRVRLVAPTQTLNYAYDPVGRLTGIKRNGASVVQYVYNALGNVQSATNGNGIVTAYAYDNDGLLTDVVTAKGALPLREIHYTLDAGGRRTGETAENFTASYAFDALDRLIGATLNVAGTPKTYAYTYDAAGNRLTANEAGTLTTFTYDAANQIATINGNAVTHDAAGRFTSDGTDAFAWDALGRLIAVTGPGRNDTFAYDGDGNLVRESDGATTRDHLVDIAGGLPTRLASTAAGAAISYVHGDGLVAEFGADTIYSHGDALRSVRATSDATGGLVQRFDYTPFGAALGTGSTFGFTGEPTIAGSALLHLRARNYSPVLGRFLSPDPLPLPLFSQSANLYSYALNDPINLADHSGQFVPLVIGGIVVAVVVTTAVLANQQPPPAADAIDFNATPRLKPRIASGAQIGVDSTGVKVRGLNGSGVLDLNTAGVISKGNGGVLDLNTAGVISKGNGGIVTPGAGSPIVTPGAGAGVLDLNTAGVISKGNGGVLDLNTAGVLDLNTAGVISKGNGGIVTPGAGGG